MLKLENIQKTFPSGSRTITVLSDIDLLIRARSTVAIIGPSGSGKTTLLGLCAGLDRPTAGRVLFNDIDLGPLTEDQLADIRRDQTGFVFQTFRLLPSLTAKENVMIPAELKGDPQAAARADELLDQVGLSERRTHYPRQLSGGEQQRVALARAFINQPKIIFADEPTGNLDDETGQHILDLLFGLNRDQGTTLMVVTHDHALTERVQSIVTLKSGRIVATRATGHR